MVQNYREKLKNVTTFIFDFDGVLSDGKIFVLADGDQIRGTHVKDGYALQYALKMGYRVAIISGGVSETMRLRFKNFSKMDIFLRVTHKLPVFEEYCKSKNIKPEETLYMGDDLPDFELMQRVGVKTCPADACEEIKAIAEYISFQKGGEGCVRDIIEQTLKAQGKWADERFAYHF